MMVYILFLLFNSVTFPSFPSNVVQALVFFGISEVPPEISLQERQSRHEI